jgi:hypothetical protein
MFVTARCAGPGVRLRRLNLGDCATSTSVSTTGVRGAPVPRGRPRRAEGTQPARLPTVPPGPAAPGRPARANGFLAAGPRTEIVSCCSRLRQGLQAFQEHHEGKPYAIRSPSRNARHTALRTPGGSISTSGCSRRHRSSLRTWSGGPGGTSCTGQYRHPSSGPRNRLLKTRLPATAHPHADERKSELAVL